jgi:hypothetical protein
MKAGIVRSEKSIARQLISKQQQRIRKQQSNNFRCYVTALKTLLLNNREAVFSVWSMPRGYKMDKENRLSCRVSRRQSARIWSLRAEELELGRVPVLAIAE